jgi:hypothetical protein
MAIGSASINSGLMAKVNICRSVLSRLRAITGYVRPLYQELAPPCPRHILNRDIAEYWQDVLLKAAPDFLTSVFLFYCPRLERPSVIARLMIGAWFVINQRLSLSGRKFPQTELVQLLLLVKLVGPSKKPK